MFPGFPSIYLKPDTGNQASRAVSEGFLPGVPSTSIIPVDKPPEKNVEKIDTNPEPSTTCMEKDDPQTLANFCMNLQSLAKDLEGDNNEK